MTMRPAPFVRRAWLVAFAGFCLSFTFAIAYSHVFAGAALVFLAIDLLFNRESHLSGVEKRLYSLAGAYVLWEIASALLSDSPGRSLWTLKEEWLFLLIPLTFRALRQERWREWLLSLAAVSTVVVGLYGWLQHFFAFNLRPERALTLLPDGQARAGGVFHNTLTYGNLFAMLGAGFVTLAFFAERRELRVLYALAGVFACGATVFTYSRGSIVALVVGLTLAGALSLRASRKVAIAMLALITLSAAALAPSLVDRFGAAGFSTDVSSQSIREQSVSRFTIWSVAVKMIEDNPMFGVGPGNFYDGYVAKADPKLTVHFSHAHNDTLNVAAYAGLPAAALYLGLWGYLLFVLARSYFRAGLSREAAGALAISLTGAVVFFVSSLTEAAFADEEVRSFLMVLWGIGLWAVERQSQPPAGQSLQAHL